MVPFPDPKQAGRKEDAGLKWFYYHSLVSTDRADAGSDAGKGQHMDLDLTSLTCFWWAASVILTFNLAEKGRCRDNITISPVRYYRYYNARLSLILKCIASLFAWHIYCVTVCGSLTPPIVTQSSMFHVRYPLVLKLPCQGCNVEYEEFVYQILKCSVPLLRLCCICVCASVWTHFGILITLLCMTR